MLSMARKESDAGAMPSQQARPRGGDQPELRDGAVRGEGDSFLTHKKIGRFEPPDVPYSKWKPFVTSGETCPAYGHQRKSA